MELSTDAIFRNQVPRSVFQDSKIVGKRSECGEAAGEIGWIEEVNGDVVL
jgi:hypothetical protein